MINLLSSSNSTVLVTYCSISEQGEKAIGRMYVYYGYYYDLLANLIIKRMRDSYVMIPVLDGGEDSKNQYLTYIWKFSGILLWNFLWRLKMKYLVLEFNPLALFYIATMNDIQVYKPQNI